MKELNRIQVGEFKIENSISIKELEELCTDNIEKIKNKIISIEEIFKDKKIIKLDKRKLKLFLNGVMITVNNEDGVYRVYCENEFIGSGIVENERIKRDVIIKD